MKGKHVYSLVLHNSLHELPIETLISNIRVRSDYVFYEVTKERLINGILT